MKDPRIPRKRTRLAGLVLAIAASAAASSASAKDSAANRYPYDPACPWGRIANGKGLLVRCMTEAESQALLNGNIGARPATAAPASADGAGPTTTASSAADDKDKDGDKDETSSDDDSGKLVVDVAPPVPDKGKLTGSKLGSSGAALKYRRCVTSNGGIEHDDAEVTVRFLVRERGRAEGVSVAKRTGVSAKAAQCVANVVDRRYAGTADVAITGASVVIKFSKQ